MTTAATEPGCLDLLAMLVLAVVVVVVLKVWVIPWVVEIDQLRDQVEQLEDAHFLHHHAEEPRRTDPP